MDTEQSMQAFLDSLSQLPGSLLFRNDNEWEALAPGNEGEILTLDSSLLPTWQWKQSYFPGMMQYNGTNAAYQKTAVTFSNNPWNLVTRFTRAPSATIETIFLAGTVAQWCIRFYVDAVNAVRLQGWDATNTLYLDCRSTHQLDDGQPHTMFVAYDPTTGVLQMIADGEDVLDTAWPSHLVLQKNLLATAAGRIDVGREPSGIRFWAGSLGFLGFKHQAALDWQDFMHPNGTPKPIDISTWWQWNGQPLVWHESGKLDENRGSLAAFTKFGTPLLADPLLWS